MDIDLSAARDFLAGHARQLDRQRFRAVLGEGGAANAALDALEAYRNDDGGYGWGLEPDLRSPESQPGGALHAFEVFADIGPRTSPRAAELCDWLASVSLSDGGLPFALPVTSTAACAPFWASADSRVSSLQITAIVAAVAHRVAAHDAAVARHPWLDRATGYCLATIGALDEAPAAMELAFAVQFLAAARDAYPDAAALLDKLAARVPADGLLHVTGGADDEYMRPLDFTPFPGVASRRLFDQAVVDAELRKLAAAQQPDGGWRVDFTSYSPAATLDWRGHATVRAVTILRAHGVQ